LRTEITSLKDTIRDLHNCGSACRESVYVQETYENETVWEGDVYVFDLERHPSAEIAYAWAAPVEGSDKLRYYAVLHAGPVKSPADAVRAAIAEEYHRTQD